MTPARDEGRRGEWMLTASGRQVWPLDLRPEDICIEDVAHHLANICRFGGACRTFYSVAEHCVRASQINDPAEPALVKLSKLLHDGPEYVLGDLVRPLKYGGGLDAYIAAEAQAASAFCRKFGLPEGALDTAAVKHADNVMLATEKRDLTKRPDIVGGPAQGDGRVAPLVAKIVPWSPVLAHQRFLMRFYEITGLRHTFDGLLRTIEATRPIS